MRCVWVTWLLFLAIICFFGSRFAFGASLFPAVVLILCAACFVVFSHNVLHFDLARLCCSSSFTCLCAPHEPMCCYQAHQRLEQQFSSVNKPKGGLTQSPSVPLPQPAAQQPIQPVPVAISPALPAPLPGLRVCVCLCVSLTVCVVLL